MPWRTFLAMLMLLTAFLPTVTHAQDYAIRPQFENVGHFHDGLAPAMRGGQWGFINVRGQWVVEPQFESVKAGADRRFGVLRRGLWGYIDSAGRMAIPFRFQEGGRFSDGAAVVSQDGQSFFVIDPTGRDMNEGTRFRKISLMRDGLAAVLTERGEWTALRRGVSNSAPVPYVVKNNHDLQGGTRADIESLTPFSEALAFLLHQGKYSVLHYEQYGFWPLLMPDGSREIDRFPAFQSVRRFKNGLAAVSVDGASWGYIDRNARFVITPRFQAAREFSEGVAPVKLNGLWGYADRSGNIVFPPSFDRAYSFREGFATMRSGDLRGFLRNDEAGRISVAYPPQFEDVFSFQEGLAPVKVGGRWGFIRAPGVDVRPLPAIRQETALTTVRP